MSDKRQAPRIAKPLEVDCRTIGEHPISVPARVSDLSTTGAFLDSMNPAPTGTRLALRISLPGAVVALEGEVVHEMPHFGMGVRFVAVPQSSRAEIVRFLLTHYTGGSAGPA